jgi:hypothetical protein
MHKKQLITLQLKRHVLMRFIILLSPSCSQVQCRWMSLMSIMFAFLILLLDQDLPLVLTLMLFYFSSLLSYI